MSARSTNHLIGVALGIIVFAVIVTAVKYATPVQLGMPAGSYEAPYCEQPAKGVRVFIWSHFTPGTDAERYFTGTVVPAIKRGLLNRAPRGFEIEMMYNRSLTCRNLVRPGYPATILSGDGYGIDMLNIWFSHAEVTSWWDGHVCNRSTPDRPINDYIETNSKMIWQEPNGVPRSQRITEQDANRVAMFAANIMTVFAYGCPAAGDGSGILNRKDHR